jgi:hypothetical protein
MEQHVIPVNDLEPHTDHGYNCPCNPFVDCDGDNVLVVHNAFDGRDIIEKLESINPNENKEETP